MSGWFNYGPGGANTASVFGFWRLGEWVRSGGLRSVDLNVVGWVALLSPGVVLGLLVARLTDSSFWVFGAIGGASIWTFAVLIDNFRYGRRPARINVDRLDDGDVARVFEAARHAGIRVEHEYVTDPDGLDRSEWSTQQRFSRRLSHLLWEIRRTGDADA